MFSKWLKISLMMGILSTAGHAAWAAKGNRITMLVVPARYSVMQVAFDIAKQYPVVLVSYQGDATSENPRLHAWNGRDWIPVSLQDYREASFLQIRPNQTILVGDDKLLPPVMASISTWCPNIETIASIDTASLVNALGRMFNFRQRDWAWYAARYNLTLTDENERLRQDSWYDHPFVEGASSPKPRAEDLPEATVSEPILPTPEPAGMGSQTPLPSASVEVGQPQGTPGPATSDVKEPLVPLEWEEKATTPVP